MTPEHASICQQGCALSAPLTGLAIAALRERYHVRQRALASALNYSSRQIRRLEHSPQELDPHLQHAVLTFFESVIGEQAHRNHRYRQLAG
jgi:DNA-binding transcriptional regulator YiaG